MAKAQRAGGLYYREDGTAVDGNGIVIADAPERPAFTAVNAQIGGSAPSSDERLAVAVAGAVARELAKPAVSKDDSADKTTAKAK